MINYVVYSHTDYLDILSIQAHYFRNYRNRTLLININNLGLQHIYDCFDQVLFYSDDLPYASRLLTLKELKYEYVLLTHDIDILISKDDAKLESLYAMMPGNMDRLDLQYLPPEFNPDAERIQIDDQLYLQKQTNLSIYPYNVNPSIWKLSVLIDIMTAMKDCNYRNIEHGPTQHYCQEKGYRFFKPVESTYIKAGYYKCVSFYQFLHITHCGTFLPKESNDLEPHLNREYQKIISMFLSDAKRPFKTNGLF